MTAKKGTFRIPVSNGILTPEHYQRMGDSIWYFMWCVDRTTKEVADGTGNVYGTVLGGMPCHDKDIASSFGVHVNTIRTWRIRLTKEKYIKATRTPNGYSIKVLKSKKWPNRLTENSESQKTVSHSSLLGDSQDPGLDPQNHGLDSQQTANAIRQDKDSIKTETKTKRNAPEIPAAASPDFESLKKKIWKNYHHGGSERQPLWREAEDKALHGLTEAGHKPRTIFYAHRKYIEQADEWEKKNNYPFCAFAQKFEQYSHAEDEEEENSPEDDRPPTYERNMRINRERATPEWLHEVHVEDIRPPHYEQQMKIVAKERAAREAAANKDLK